MNKSTFNFTIKSDLALNSNNFIHISDDEQQLYITSNVLKYLMREQFRNRFERTHLNKNEEYIFGILNALLFIVHS